MPRGALDIRVTRPLTTRAEVQAFVAAVEMGERMMGGVREECGMNEPMEDSQPLAIIERRCTRCGTGRLSLPADPSDSCPTCHCAAWHDTKKYLSVGLIQAIRQREPTPPP